LLANLSIYIEKCKGFLNKYDKKKRIYLFGKPKECSFVFEFDDRVFAPISRGWTLVACRAVYEKEQIGLASKPMILVLKASF
jgi:hypothetical protein